MTRWDNIGLAVDRSIHLFIDAASNVSGVRRIDAKSSGPSVHFVVATDEPWYEVIDGIEAKLFTLAHAGELPALDYDVRTIAEAPNPDPGYVQVFPA
jgi:hypothetical protein